MISATYLGLQKVIAAELGDRQDLLVPETGMTLSPIQRAIQSAIAKWEQETFYFNRFRIDTPLGGPATVSTAYQQEYYGATTAPNAWPQIPKLAAIKRIWVLISSNRYTLNPRTPQYLDDISVNPAVVSQPVDYAYDTQQFRLYPIPDGAYPIGIWGTIMFDALEDDADSNPWTDEAYDLIRCEAKLQISRDFLHDDEIETKSTKAIYGDPAIQGQRGYLSDLRKRTTRREANSRVKPTYF